MIGHGHGRTFKVRIDDVLEALTLQREKHEAIVEEAQTNFRAKVIEELDRMLADAKAGKKIRTSVELLAPESRLDTLDNAIETLGLVRAAGETTVELTAHEIDHFVRGKWAWVRDFLVTNAAYSDRASAAVEAMGE